MKKILLPIMLLLAACQNKPLIQPNAVADLNNKAKGSLQALAGTTRTDSLYGASVHFGTLNNSDYTASKVGYAMKLARIMHWNYFRADATTDAMGIPSNPAFDTFIDSSYNAGFGVFAVLGNPSLPPPANSSGYNSAEINGFYLQGYKRGNGFATRYSGKIQFIQVMNWNLIRMLVYLYPAMEQGCL